MGRKYILTQQCVSQGKGIRAGMLEERKKMEYVLYYQAIDGKNVFKVFQGLIPQLIEVNGKNFTDLMDFGTESCLIVYL